VSKRIHILHVITQLDTGGAERQLLALCSVLPPERFANRVVSLKAGGSLREDFAAAGCPVIELDRRAHGGPAGQLLALAALIRRERPDLVQTWLLKANHVGRLAASLAGQHPLVASYRDMGFKAGPGDTLLDRLLAAGTTLVLHNSARGRAAFLARTGDTGRTLHQILPNGVDTDRFRPDPLARRRLREELGIGAGDPVVLMVARLFPEKDPSLFLAVGRRVRQALPSARFWLVGGGYLAPRIQAELDAQPDPGLWLAGERADIPALLAAADLALLTSHSEGLSNTILEAMASSLPVLAMDVGGNRELIRNGENGFLLESRDPAKIAAVVVQVLQNQVLASKLGACGRQRAEAEFSLNRLAIRSIEYYERLIESG
jgi:glycosyltransferase involved in cell wall biosynthesis